MRYRLLFVSTAAFFLAAPAAFAANITLSAPSQVTVGQTFQVTATVTGAIDVDTMRLQGTFPASLLTWRGSSVGTLPYQSPGNYYDQKNGTFYFGAFSLIDKVNGKARLATFTVQAKQAGTAQIKLVTGSHILSAGEEELGTLGRVSIKIIPAKAKVRASAIFVTSTIQISSTSHPDPEAWYANGHVSVAWNVQDAQVKTTYIGFDQIPEGSADTTSTNGFATFDVPQDGVWYVHLRIALEDGTFQMSHFRVQVDRQPPHAVVPTVDQTNVLATVPNTLRFGTMDDTSGVARYEVFMDGSFVTSTIYTAYLLNRLEPGEHAASVTAYDYAGNHAEGSAQFLIIPERAPVAPPAVNQNRMLIAWAAILIGIGLPLSWLFFFLKRLRRTKRVRPLK